jgi:general secretion pathway protein A
MYNAHYQFRESPFGVTPDPQFYYSNAVYREAWATLRYGIEGRKGFVVIAGEAGTGKTTLLRKALHEFPPSIRAAYIPNTLLSFSELLRLILKDLGLPSSTEDKFDMMERLNQYLLAQFNSGRTVAVLMDEAQDLTVQCLEELRLLGNLETDKHKLLQIVLVGQPGLERKLNQPELLQLKQRVVLRCRLWPVESGEVGPYIESRLQTIGRSSEDLFDPEAIAKIAVYSKGFPRLINIICDNALLTAYAVSKLKVSAAMIDEVAGDLLLGEPRLETQVRSRPPPRPVEQRVSFQPARADNALTRAEPLLNGPDHGSMGRRRDSTLSGNGSHRARPITGTTAAIVLLGVFGAFLYSQRGAFSAFNFNFAGNIAAPIAGERNEIDRGTTAAHAPDAEPVTMNPQLMLPTTYIETGSVSDQDNARLEETTKVTAPASTVLITPENKKAKSPPRDDRRENASSTGNFFVAAVSFVRSKPTSSADIIATLEPGTRINVAGRTGDYYRVRSLGAETIRGYVHEEDAFFERH